MSLHALAHSMASKGRGPDTMLVHMAPREVAGLHALAKAHGGALTTNPDTGLPEAGFLSSLLPTLIGAGLSIASGGTLTPMMAAMMTGGGYGLMTGSLNKGLMAGLGAFGGAGLGGGLFAAGAEGLGANALSSAGAEMGAQTAAQAGAGLEASLAGQGITPVAGATGASAGAQTAAQLGQGFANSAGAAASPMNGVNQGVLNAISPGATTTTPAAMAASTVTPMPAATPAPAPVVAAPSTAPTFSDNFARAGQGISNLGSKEGVNAFMSKEGVGGDSGLLKYGMSSLLPAMMQQEKTAQYKGSGPNPYNYSYSANRQDPNATYTGHPSGERRWFDPVYTSIPTATPMAAGGLTAFADGGMNNLGGYSDGGHLLKGPGDGVSDSIPATIGNRQPARLADGEFVVPARIVSELGNGSTEAGARRLYQMMDRVQQARGKTTGKGKVAVNSRAEKALPV